MGRLASVSIEHVQNAIEALRAEGKNVSSRSVREKLGNIGSMGTINRLLQQCMNEKAEPPGSLRQLPADLQHAVLTYADRHAEEARAEIASELMQCKNEMADLADDNDRLTETIEYLRQQENRLVAEAAAIHGRTAQLTSELESMRQEIATERHAAESARIESAKFQAHVEQLAPLVSELRDARAQLEIERTDHMRTQQDLAVVNVQKAALESLNQGLADELAETKHVCKTSSEKIEKLAKLLEQEREGRAIVERELAVRTAMHAHRRLGNGFRTKKPPRDPQEEAKAG